MRIRWFLTGGVAVFLLIVYLTEDLPFVVHVAQSVVKLFARKSQQIRERAREEPKDLKVKEPIASIDSTDLTLEQQEDLGPQVPMPFVVPTDSTPKQPGTELDSLFTSVGEFKEELWKRIAPSKDEFLQTKEPKSIPRTSGEESVDRMAIIDLLDRTDVLYDSLLGRNP